MKKDNSQDKTFCFSSKNNKNEFSPDTLRGKEKVSWIRFILLILTPIMLGLMSFGMPERICYLSGMGLDCMYGYVASCAVICIVFILIAYPKYLLKEVSP